MRAATFVHIPKAAGTTVEKTLLKHGMRVGIEAPWLDAPPYQTADDAYGKCAFWHRPPLQRVPGGLCVVREPASRLLSEFCFGTFRQSDFWALYRGYSRKFLPTCEGFNQWVLFVLGCYGKGSPTIHDCHLVPQYHYASKCDAVVSMDDLRSGRGGRGWGQVLEHFSLPRGAAIATAELNMTETLHNRAVQQYHPLSARCVRSVTLGCLQEPAIRAIQKHFSLDYEHLSRHFTVPAGWQ